MQGRALLWLGLRRARVERRWYFQFPTRRYFLSSMLTMMPAKTFFMVFLGFPITRYLGAQKR